MSWLSRPTPEPASDPVDTRVKYAIGLTEEVSAKIRERANSVHPFRGVLVDLILGPPSVVDVALVADAYEMAQESRIFHGLNGGIERRRNKI